MAAVISIPDGKLNNVLKAELKGLMKSFGWEFHQHANGRHYAKDNLGRDRIVNADKSELERSTLAFLREQIAGKAGGANETTEDSTVTAITSETDTTGARALSLSDQMAELESAGADGGTLASMITFEFRGHQPSEYPALKERAKSNPKFGDGRDSSAFTADEKLARASFLICHGWEKEARKRSGVSPTTRATSAGTITSKTTAVPKRAGVASRDLLIALAGWDGALLVDDLRAMVGEAYASAITIPAFTLEEIRARNLAKGLKDRASASAPTNTTMDEARELAADLERDVYVVKIGTRHEVCGLKYEKMEAKYLALTNASLVAVVGKDGAIFRNVVPLSVATIAPAIVASLTPPVDPASLTPQERADVAAD